MIIVYIENMNTMLMQILGDLYVCRISPTGSGCGSTSCLQ